MTRPRRRPATPAPVVSAITVDPALPALGSKNFRDLALATRASMTVGRAGDLYGDLVRRYVGLPVPGPQHRADLAPFLDHPVVAHVNAAISAHSTLDSRWYVESYAATAAR